MIAVDTAEEPELDAGGPRRGSTKGGRSRQRCPIRWDEHRSHRRLVVQRDSDRRTGIGVVVGIGRHALESVGAVRHRRRVPLGQPADDAGCGGGNHLVAQCPATHLKDDLDDSRTVARRGVEVGGTREDRSVGGDTDSGEVPGRGLYVHFGDGPMFTTDPVARPPEWSHMSGPHQQERDAQGHSGLIANGATHRES